jgi:hypothetical protein
MSGQRPNIKIRVKVKSGQAKPIYVMAGWSGSRGTTIQLEKGWSLVSPDGETFTSGRDGNSYFDLFDDRDKKPAEEREHKSKAARGFADDCEDGEFHDEYGKPPF